MSNAIANDNVRELSNEELESVYAGSFLEGEIGGGKRIDIYRAGVTYVNCAFGSDEFYIGSQRIPKETADEIVRQGRKLWNAKYMSSGDLIGFSREWKTVLMQNWGISWNGKMGEYKAQVF